jgi:hypothetical protein
MDQYLIDARRNRIVREERLARARGALAVQIEASRKTLAEARALLARLAGVSAEESILDLWGRPLVSPPKPPKFP